MYQTGLFANMARPEPTGPRVIGIIDEMTDEAVLTEEEEEEVDGLEIDPEGDFEDYTIRDS